MAGKLKEISSKIFTLSYPKYRLVFLLIVVLLLVFLPFQIIEKTHEFSICSKILGKYCYSVGITRGVSCLLRGEFQQAIDYNFLSIPVLIIIFLLIFFDFFEIIKKKKIKK